MVLLLGLLTLAAISPDHDATEPDLCAPQDLVFAPGEEIVYKLFYNWNFVWLAAGEVVFKVEEKEDLLYLSATGRTYKSYEWFYKVRDKYECFVDKHSLRPVRSSRSIEEGKYREYDDTEFDFDRNIAISEVGKSMDTRETSEVSIDPCVHDILSCLYSVRSIPVQDLPGETRLPLSIYLDKEVYNLDMIYRGKTKKRVKGLGKCSTLLLEPQLIVGDVFKDDKGMKIWASDDENRIPLMIESPVSVGSVKAVLREYRGAKFPFEPGKK